MSAHISSKEELSAELEVQPGQPPNNTWSPAKGSDGSDYAYRFDGTTGKKGRLNVIAKTGLKTFRVDLHKDVPAAYVFGGITFFDPTGQLWIDVKASSDRTLFIKDNNDQVMEAYYAVVVVLNDKVKIACDPMIKNEP